MTERAQPSTRLGVLALACALMGACPTEMDGDTAARDVPGLDAPRPDVPGLDAPGVDVPGLDVPGLDVPGLDAPGVDAPGLDVPGVDAPLPPRDVPLGSSGAVHFVRNARAEHEYGLQLVIPSGFGRGDFTFELFVRLDESYPVGPTTDGSDGQLTNWSDADVRPYSRDDWWYEGNFLLDGHNNSSFGAGTFSLQFYGGGRVRWMFGDGDVPDRGNVWSVGAFPASSTPSLLDDLWHGVALVRRGRMLELWIDGVMIDTETLRGTTDMRAYFDGWPGFPMDQEGWFWGAEKQAAIGALSQYEDYKGDLGELRFWTLARSATDLSGWDVAVAGTEPGLVGRIPFDEGTGNRACDALDRSRCIVFSRTDDSLWTSGPPLR